jgi:AcrR family transcriptional regulator
MKEKTFQRKDQVIEAALDEFITNDYEKASLNTIIKSAGISKGTFYYHFKNKEALYLYLLKTSADTKWQYINQQTRFHIVDFNRLDIFDKFLYQAELGAGFAALYPKYHTLSLMFSKEKNNPIYRTAIKFLGGNTTDIITPMVKEAIEKHEIKEEFDETFIVKILRHLLSEFDQIFDEESDYEKNKVLTNLKNYVNFIKYGLKSK